ncbi:NAD(P)-binding protein [Rhizodiscina lignyota]|uniref:NAD(P)-binding protein n=1 Tax=Rhizodiscina lignyota TaxID=1504668 RepID=A0A9P4IQV6_9PEZI|nr:NAD(P)-binding protein [Rhizodiscina lignyota]
MAIGIAILGAGIFAKTEHLPAVQACSDLELKAVYSRSEKSAQSVVSDSSVGVYFDNPPTSDRTLKTLLSRSDIQAVIVVLPINNQPAIVKQCIEAGKHVLSEKPIARDVKDALELTKWYEAYSSPQKPIWGVAENWRYYAPFLKAADLVKEMKQNGGKLVTFRLEVFGFMSESSEYYHTEWRKTPEFQGGFVLDGGVHYAAGIRMLLAAAGEELAELSAFTNLVDDNLPLVDTVNATMKTSSGTTGTFSATWASPVRFGAQMEIAMTNGAVAATPVDVIVKKKGAEDKIDFKKSSGVKEEVDAFAKSILSGEPDPLLSPREATLDVEVIEKILQSGEQKGAPQALTAKSQ